MSPKSAANEGASSRGTKPKAKHASAVGAPRYVLTVRVIMSSITPESNQSTRCASSLNGKLISLFFIECFTDEATPSSLKASSLRSREEIKALKDRLGQVEAVLNRLSPNHPILFSSPLERDHDTSRPACLNTTNANSPEDHDSPESAHSSIPGAANRTADPSRYAGRPPSDVQVNLNEAIDIFGTLSIGEDGMPVFNGATSQAENFITKISDPHSNHAPMPVEQPSLPPSVQLLSVLFPFPPPNFTPGVDINELAAFLPSPAEVLETCEIYWYHLSIGAAPISHHQFTKHIYTYFFPPSHPHSSPHTSTPISERTLVKADAHKLGLLFMIMALGALTDLRLAKLSAEAEKWYQLGRAALTIDPICDNTSIAGLQTMLMMASYIRHAPARGTPGYRWAFGGLIVKLGNSLGIVRDPRRWLTDADEIEQREVLCWELISNEIWQCFSAGRPCSLDLSLVDCPKPGLKASTHAGLDGFIRGYSNWRHKFFPLVNEVLRVVQRPGPVKYSEILALERDLRFCRMPEELESCVISPMKDTFSNTDITKHLQGITALMWREGACCMLHRRFLGLAMQNSDPRDSPFWYSAFQAGFGACWIVKAHLTLYKRHPELLDRVPGYWSTAFSAAVILGSIAARHGNTEYAKPTVAPFMVITELFLKTKDTSIQPVNASEILQRLRQRVKAHLASTGSGDTPKSPDPFYHDPGLLEPSTQQSARSSLSLSPSLSSSDSPSSNHMSSPPSNLSSLSPSLGLPSPLSPGNQGHSPHSPHSPHRQQQYAGNVNANPGINLNVDQQQQQQQTPGGHAPTLTPEQQQQSQAQYYQHQNLHLLEQLWTAPDLSVLPEYAFGFGGENAQGYAPAGGALDQRSQWGPGWFNGNGNGLANDNGSGNGNGMNGGGGYMGLPMDAVSHVPVEHYMMVDGGGVPEGAGVQDVGQWDQYLDRLGMWDVGLPEGVGGAAGMR
ncbi:hypothetical protein M422DRAFT_777084 [Sphaerobolus stellatus SS14]|nr:hypothetical protein M422DRAFT_777084 [Sphaerobolus stellatus SS14]